MRPIDLLALAFALTALSCTEDVDVVVPQNPEFVLPAAAQPIPYSIRPVIAGVYRVSAGNEVFGDFVVLKWSYVADGPDTTHYLSIFSGKEVAYFVLQGGVANGAFFFSGYWRRMTTTETGSAFLTIRPDSGGSNLYLKTPIAIRDSLMIGGVFTVGDSPARRPIVLLYQRPLSAAHPLGVIAHRAGGRSSDLLPVTENTVEMALYAERFGATGIEIDVRLTSDGIPILYHDENLNLRINEKNGLVGAVESYSYTQLQTFVRLIHGEKIPTLREVLDAVLYKTNLRFVWLDMKSGRPSMAIVRQIQREYLLKAAAEAAKGRRNQLFIGIGLPTEEKVEEFLTLPDWASAPALCELSLDDVRRTGAEVWAPRWTLGVQSAEVAQMHAEGRKAFVWTLDVPAYVAQFVATGDFDAILSNYPSIVAFSHYVQQP
jgi:glycerophosphoryl diester phosphodiesterase